MKLIDRFNSQIWHRRIVLILFDIMAVCFSSIVPLWLRFIDEETIPDIYLASAWDFLLINIVLTLVVFYLFKLYQSLWAFAGPTEAQNIVAACFLCAVLDFGGMKLLHYQIPRSYFFLYALVLTCVTTLGRFSYRFARSIKHKARNKKNAIKVMVIGAGEAGNTVIKEIVNSSYSTMTIKCIIDDNSSKWGQFIQGIKIVGGRDKIVESAAFYGIDEIIIAIPSAKRATMRELVEICQETNCKLRTLPGIYQLVNGEVNVSRLRDVDVEDLLGRDPIKVDMESIYNYVKDKVILVTGGGGSIGSELCRQIAGHQPKQLIIIDIYENNAYDIQQELKYKYPQLDLVVLIASVRNTNRINHIMEQYHPDIVYHAAAHKHVPLMEDSPNEAIKNNVFGTWKTAQAAVQNGVKKFVMISTDKAVNPTNIMGASKRICEMIIQTYNRHYDTEFVAVRFGNVLGSNGSVIPLFKRQILAGGPVTVTHPDIIRYFMTIPEAVSLVLQAGVYAKGGEIFVLDMGEPVKILDLAKNLIKLSGYKVDEDIKIEFTGLRPGEKLYEELLMNEEGLTDTENKLIDIGKPIEFDEVKFYAQLNNLKKAVEMECEDVRPLIKEIVPTYIPRKREMIDLSAAKEERKRIYLSCPTMHGEEQKYVQEAFDTNWVAPLGPNVNAFEKEMAEYTGCGHAAALSAGTAAIHLAIKLLGVEEGDRVFVSDLTFSASCNPITYEKAIPVLIDSEPDTWNMSPKALRKAFEKYPHPKAVICVHLYGTPARLDEIMAICAEHNVPLIEDAAESLGSTYKGQFTGTFGRIGIYSFNGNKIITTSGGGMLVSKEEELVKQATFLATQARDPARYYQHSHIGYNYRMSNVTAGIGRGQLLHIQEHKQKKNDIYAQYKKAFADIEEISMNPMNPDGDANNWLSCITIKPDCKITPDQIMDTLDALNIESRPIWKPMHLQPVFADCEFFNHNEDGISVGEDIFNRGLCLPSDIKNTPEDMELIISTIRKLFGK